MKDLWSLFFSFARIGCFTFGGGYAMLPMLQKEIVEKHHWTTEAEIMDFYAIGQCTPGVIAINTATFIGYKRHKLIGSIVATLGMIIPSLIIIMSIAALLQNFSGLAIIENAFSGIRIVVAVLVINVVTKMYRTAVKDWIGLSIFILSFAVGLITDLSPIYFIITAALIGIVKHRQGGFKNL